MWTQETGYSSKRSALWSLAEREQRYTLEGRKGKGPGLLERETERGVGEGEGRGGEEEKESTHMQASTARVLKARSLGDVSGVNHFRGGSGNRGK